MAGGRILVARRLPGSFSGAEEAPRATPDAGLTVSVVEVSREEYLAHRRPIPYLFEITPDLDPAAFATQTEIEQTVVDDEEPEVSATALASTVRAQGDRDTDVRLLVDDGERHVALAHDLADTLGCDVYLTPRGAVVRYLRESHPVAGDTWEAMAVDPATGEPVDWVVVRPDGLPPSAATWFVSVRGRLRRGQGLVTVDLPDGVAFATRATYRDSTHLAARLMPSLHALTTVAVNADHGRFEIARFEDEPEPPPAVEPPRRRLVFGRGPRETTRAGGMAGREAGTTRPGVQLGGAEFATLVRASLDAIHPDVQVALTWPTDPGACAILHEQLLALADGLERTVWVPEPPGAAFVLSGVGEFVAVDEVGAPSRWRAYPPSTVDEKLMTLFGTDLDGRLTPLGEVSAARFPSVPFVSVPPPQLDHLRHWYNAIAPQPGLFPIDLTVLPDGRLGVWLQHGVPVVAGPRELQAMLRDAGWSGEDLLLLAQPPASVWNTTIDHARALVEGLRTDLWLATLDADVWVQADGTLAADGPDGADQAWCCVAFGRAAAAVTLPATLAAPRLTDGRVVRRPAYDPTSAVHRSTAAVPARTGPHGSAAGVADELTQRLPQMSTPARSALTGAGALALVGGLTSGALVSSCDPASDGASGGPKELTGIGELTGLGELTASGELTSAVTGAGPAPLGRALGLQAPHGIPWLPESPAVNPHPMDLYLWTPLTSDQVEAWGLPSADLFLLAGQDPLRLADRRPTGYLLRVQVPAGGAVDLREHPRQVPAPVQQRLVDTGNTHLLPLAWLRDMRVTARFDLDGAGGVRARTDVGVGELAIRFEGAEHGVTGLPNEVVHWPDKGSRADAPCYLLLPQASAMSLSIIHGGYVALYRKKPAMQEGYRLLEVKVRKRRAVDVPATLDSLAGMNIVGRMHDFVGLDLLLPETDLDKAVVTKIWRNGPTGRPVMEKLSGATLYDALLDETLLTSQKDRVGGPPNGSLGPTIASIGPRESFGARDGSLSQPDRTPALVG